MPEAASFSVPDDGSFYVIIGAGSTVYETYDAAVEEIQEKLNDADDAFVAEMSINGTGDDVEVNFSQVEWPKIISDMDEL